MKRCGLVVPRDGRSHKLGVLLVGVLIIRVLLFGAYIHVTQNLLKLSDGLRQYLELSFEAKRTFVRSSS